MKLLDRYFDLPVMWAKGEPGGWLSFSRVAKKINPTREIEIVVSLSRAVGK